jgi:hypothetical protein
MSFGANIRNDMGILQVSENSMLNIYSGTSSSGTLPSGPIFVRASNSAAGIYKNPLNNLIYTTDGGVFEFIRMTPTSEEVDVTSGFGLKIRNGNNLTVFESSRKYPAIALNKDVLQHNDWGRYTDTMIQKRPGSNYYIDSNSLKIATYNRTLNGNTNAFVIVASFSENIFNMDQTQIILGPGGSGNYTEPQPNRILILNA